jgi:hypothetical protein
MRRVDAPPAGWYPDPQNRAELRWWDGLDWTEARRASPSRAELRSYEQVVAASPPVGEWAATAGPAVGAVPGRIRLDPTALAEEARRAARGEVDRTAQRLAQQAQAARREIEPLISQYSSRITHWLKVIAILAILLLVAYVVFQVLAQASLFEWIGDRIDNVTDENGAALVPARSATGGS